MLCFDDVRLDTTTLQAFRNDVPLDAPPQVVEVLAYLIEHRDRIVPRQELLERFWPRAGTGGDAALNTCIRRIRTLLEDDAEAPRYIQTRPRAGYRFIATLAGEVDAPGPPPPTAGTRTGGRWPAACSPWRWASVARSGRTRRSPRPGIASPSNRCRACANTCCSRNSMPACAKA